MNTFDDCTKTLNRIFWDKKASLEINFWRTAILRLNVAMKTEP